jgi:polysaccharide biosynthesis protein PslG
MHYDKGCRCTQGLLLADYFKALLTGDLLPADLAAQAAGSPLLRAAASGGQVPTATVFGDAFVKASPKPATASVPAATTPSLAPLPPIPGPLVTSPDYGLNLFMWGHPTTTDRDLRLTSDAGLRWQKTLFQWREIEGRCKGCFDWSEADRVVKATSDAGLKLLVRIDFEPDWARADHAHNGRPDNLQDYADFVQAVANRYKPGSPYGHVDAIEIWNEPNLQREWGEPISPQSAANYVQMVKLAYRAIKSVSPSTLVVTAGLSPTGWSDDTARPDDQFLGWMFDAGLSGNYDVLGLHGNSQVSDPTAAPGSIPGLSDGSFYFRRVEQLRQIQVTKGDANKPIWLLEFGWTADAVHPAYAWFAVSETQKAQNLLAAFQYARANWPWLGTMFVWTLPDPSWTPDREEYWWAIANPDGSPRPALSAILAAAQAKQLPA